MNKTALYLLLVVLFCGVDRMLRAQSGESASQPSTAVASAPLILSAHSRIPLVLVRPVWAKTAKSGDPVYFETTFPVSAGAAIALPAGSFVQGRIEALTRPTGRNPHATLQILFTQLIYPNGYVVTLPGDAQDAEPAAIHMLLTIQVSVANDLLLDNGAQTEMELAAPLPLERAAVEAALPLSAAVDFKQFRSATHCVPTAGSPGTPGTPDTVIPGTPGTPPTVIPGGPGMPDTVIPGTPGMPPTVISGTPDMPGTPGTWCPGAPLVVSSVLLPPAGAAARP